MENSDRGLIMPRGRNTSALEHFLNLQLIIASLATMAVNVKNEIRSMSIALGDL